MCCISDCVFYSLMTWHQLTIGIFSKRCHQKQFLIRSLHLSFLTSWTPLLCMPCLTLLLLQILPISHFHNPRILYHLLLGHFLPTLNPLFGSFENFLNSIFSESSTSSPKCLSIPGSPQSVQICPKINMVYRTLKKEALTREPKKKKKVPRCKKQVISHQKLCYQVKHIIEKSTFVTFF